MQCCHFCIIMLRCANVLRLPMLCCHRAAPTALCPLSFPLSRRWFGIPSYYVQQMFSRARGSHYLDTTVATDPGSQVRRRCRCSGTYQSCLVTGQPPQLPPQLVEGQPCGILVEAQDPPSAPFCPLQVHQESVAASATCGSPACDRINIKIINFSSMQQRVAGACLRRFDRSSWESVLLLCVGCSSGRGHGSWIWGTQWVGKEQIACATPGFDWLFHKHRWLGVPCQQLASLPASLGIAKQQCVPVCAAVIGVLPCPALSWLCPAVVLTGEGSDAVLGEGELVYLWSDHPEAENSFDTPTKVRACFAQSIKVGMPSSVCAR